MKSLFPIFSFLAFASAAPSNATTPIKCPIIFDGRVTKNLTLNSFDTATTSPFNADFVKGVNLTWSQILLFPAHAPLSRFDNPRLHKDLEVTIDSRSIFEAGTGNLQFGFRRAGLLLKDDANDVGADAADSGAVTFHWSVKADASRPLNTSHEYLMAWHERADYLGNQFQFGTGVPTGSDPTPEDKEDWRITGRTGNVIYRTKRTSTSWQNFAVRIDYAASTVQIFYSEGRAPLVGVTEALPNDNAGGGQWQIGVAKKPTETVTVTNDGYQEYIPIRGEGLIYGGLFAEDSTHECISL